MPGRVLDTDSAGALIGSEVVPRHRDTLDHPFEDDLCYMRMTVKDRPPQGNDVLPGILNEGRRPCLPVPAEAPKILYGVCR